MAPAACVKSRAIHLRQPGGLLLRRANLLAAALLLSLGCLTAIPAASGSATCQGPSDADGVALDDNTTGACNAWIDRRLCDGSSFDPPDTPNLVRFGFMIPLSSSQAAWGTMSTFAMLCAVDAVNADASILPGVVLEPIFGDSGGTQSGGVEAGLCLMQNDRVPFVLGPQGSSVAFGAATVAKIFNVAMLGTTTSAPDLWAQGLGSDLDTRIYPTFSGIFPSDAFQGAVLARLVADYGWTAVVVIAIQDDAYSTGLAAVFNSAARELGVEVTKKLTLPGNFADVAVWDTAGKDAVNVVLEDIEDLGVTVVLVISNEPHANRVLATAKERGMLGKGWAWLGTENWVDATPDFLDLDGQPLLAEGVIGTSVSYDTTSDAYNALQTCFSAHQDDSDGPFAGLSWLSGPMQLYPAFVYDGAMFMAHVFHELSQSVASDASAAALNAVLSSDLDAVLAALRSNHTHNFDGITGPLMLDEAGKRIGAAYNIQNAVAGADGSISISSIGTYTDTQGLTLAEHAVFPGGGNAVPSCYAVEDNDAEAWKYLALTGMVLAFAGLIVLAVLLQNRNFKDKYSKPAEEAGVALTDREGLKPKNASAGF